ncbi:WXG100 family type VII secretion target [Sphaerisporangium dianthi]|uniref:ESAT-6-like protein n=1 Tax=Sphaerisporangium dianthi TaxID=1436120 RepID=A0ABV9C9H5_9ACTN
MTQQTSAQLPQIVESAKKTETAHGLIGSIQTQLQGHVAELRAGWGGQSGMAFEAVYNEWNRELSKVLGELQGLSVKLHQVEARYRNTEADQTAAANRVISGSSLSGNINA